MAPSQPNFGQHFVKVEPKLGGTSDKSNSFFTELSVAWSELLKSFSSGFKFFLKTTPVPESLNFNYNVLKGGKIFTDCACGCFRILADIKKLCWRQIFFVKNLTPVIFAIWGRKLFWLQKIWCQKHFRPNVLSRSVWRQNCLKNSFFEHRKESTKVQISGAEQKKYRSAFWAYGQSKT